MSDGTPAPTERAANKSRHGFLYGLVAYGGWGLVPLYFGRLRDDVSPSEVLAQRVVWSIAFLAGVISVLGRWHQVQRCLRSSTMRVLFLTSMLVATNWFIYIYSVARERIKDASLGYYITPLVSVALGILFFRERLRLLQWLALGFASIGVALLSHLQGAVPWLAVTLAFSFSFYGLFRKTLAVDPLVGLFVETLLLLPAALVYLGYLGWTEQLALGHVRPSLDVLIVLSGVITAIPLLAFVEAAARLPLSTLGFLQYLSPSLQLTIAVLLFEEPFGSEERMSFLCIWTGLIVFSIDSYRQYRAA